MYIHAIRALSISLFHKIVIHMIHIEYTRFQACMIILTDFKGNSLTVERSQSTFQRLCSLYH